MAETLETNFKGLTYGDVSSRFVALTSASKGRSPTGQHPCQGLYWTSKQNQFPSTAIIFVHYNADFSEHYLGGPLASRGYGVLGFNTRFRGMEDMFILEHALDDIGAGMQWLRDEAKAKKIVLVGNSGGGSLLSAYQAKAQANPGLVAGDAFIFLNAHPGRPDVFTKWLDPAVTDETDPVQTDPNLSIYRSENKPPFSEEFIKKYRAAQVARNHRITDWAIKELKRVNDAGISDRIFPVYRTVADPRFIDPNLEPSDRLTPHSYSGDPEKANFAPSLLGRTNTLRTWLSMWSLKESKCRLEPYSAEFKVPTLVIQGTADVGVFPSDARHIFESIGTKDKELRLIRGSHFFDDSQEDLDNVTELIAGWIAKKL